MVSTEASSRPRARLVWWPGLAVAFGAAVATAHGLYEVAVAAHVPTAIAWLYPLITDGLALVAYAATARLAGRAAGYAWTVMVIAAGLSGLAQAVHLASGATVDAPAVLRFGVGAWPAVAAATVAHLLYLLAGQPDETDGGRQEQDLGVERSSSPALAASVQAAPYGPSGVQRGPVSEADGRTSPEHLGATGTVATERPGRARQQPEATGAVSPASDRARSVAVRLARRSGAWPTVSTLEAEAQVSRGTAASVLKNLRHQSPALHLITTDAPEHPEHPEEAEEPDTDEHHDDERTQP